MLPLSSEQYEKELLRLRLKIQQHHVSYFVIQRELSFAHAALRRKNRQLKQLKAMIELHKDYVKQHPPDGWNARHATPLHPHQIKEQP